LFFSDLFLTSQYGTDLLDHSDTTCIGFKANGVLWFREECAPTSTATACTLFSAAMTKGRGSASICFASS